MPTENESLVKIILERIDKATGETRHEMSEMRKDVSSLATTTARQQVILEEHIRRTEVNEKALEAHKEHQSQALQGLSDRLTPLEQHVSMWGGAGKVLAVLGLLATIAAAVWKVAF